jgi:hypothetical protein
MFQVTHHTCITGDRSTCCVVITAAEIADSLGEILCCCVLIVATFGHRWIAVYTLLLRIYH